MCVSMFMYVYVCVRVCMYVCVYEYAYVYVCVCAHGLQKPPCPFYCLQRLKITFFLKDNWDIYFSGCPKFISEPFFC